MGVYTIESRVAAMEAVHKSANAVEPQFVGSSIASTTDEVQSNNSVLWERPSISVAEFFPVEKERSSFQVGSLLSSFTELLKDQHNEIERWRMRVDRNDFEQSNQCETHFIG